MEQLYKFSFSKNRIIRSVRLLVFFILIGILSAIPRNSSAQLIVTPATAQQIVTHMLGCGSAASNIVINCANGGSALFDAVNTNLGIDSGVMFTSGQAVNA